MTEALVESSFLRCLLTPALELGPSPASAIRAQPGRRTEGQSDHAKAQVSLGIQKSFLGVESVSDGVPV